MEKFDVLVWQSNKILTLREIVDQFLIGFRDSIFGFILFYNRQKNSALDNESPESKQRQTRIKANSKLRQRLLQSCVLNGIFLFFCIILFNYAIMPALTWSTEKLLTVKYQRIALKYINPIINIVFSFVWIVPVFMLSKILNFSCHKDIANIAYLQKYGESTCNFI